MGTASGSEGSVSRAALAPVFGEIGELKRIRSAGRHGSIATRLFARAWQNLVDGERPATSALRITASALAAARLGDIDAGRLAAGGVSPADTSRILRAAVAEVSGAVAEPLRAALADAVEDPSPPSEAALPAFVAALAAQPRAGVTCPGRPRIILEPPENHAEHCLVVAVLGVLLCPGYGASPDTVFLAGLSHHLHNAALPDSGFTGEMLLGPHLGPVMHRFTEQALAELPPRLRDQVATARAILPDAATPEGRAFHAADTIDRVMQIAQHLRAASLTMDRVLGDMALVHDGPVKAFQEGVLAEMALP